MFFHLGRYYLLMAKVFSRPEKPGLYFRQTIREIQSLGINSITIIIIISIFMGAMLTLQTAYNFETPLIPRYLIGLGTRDALLLEFSSTMVGLILAGKVGSNIASEIGTMRVTEQIDAMEMMGVNSASFLILPKIAAAMFFNPCLTIISVFLGLVGGYLAAFFTNAVEIGDYLFGIHYWFIPFYMTYSLIKTVIFAFLITSIPAYHGYYVKGGALEVGRASTRGVVYSSVMILLFNVILTQLMLAK